MSTSQDDSKRDVGVKPISIIGLALRITLVGLALIARGILLWQLAVVLLLVFGSILTAILLRTLAEWTARWTGLPESWSLGIVILVFTAIFAAGLYLGGQAVANQMVELADQIPQSLDKLREYLRPYEWGKRLLRAVPSVN